MSALTIDPGVRELLRVTGREDEALRRAEEVFGRLLDEVADPALADATVEEFARLVRDAVPSALAIRAAQEVAENGRRTLREGLDALRRNVRLHPRRRKILAVLAEVEALARPTM